MENMEKVVYLDNAATTPCAPEALEMMVKALSGACGNPSSHYSVGYEAKEFVDTGRAQVAKAINASPAELFFTSCGSEADNLVSDLGDLLDGLDGADLVVGHHDADQRGIGTDGSFHVLRADITFRRYLYCA